METLSITFNRPISLQDIRERLSLSWNVEDAANDRIVIHGPNSRAYIHTEHQLACDLLIDYNEVQLVKDLVEALADAPELIVDNDFGTVLPGDEFVAKCRTDGNWDWRREPVKEDDRDSRIS